MSSLREIASNANLLEDSLWLTIDAVMHKFNQEVGELNDAIQKYRWIYAKTKYDNVDMVYAEAWDVIFNFISILNRLWINPDDLEGMAKKTLDKFIERQSVYASTQNTTISEDV